MLLSTLNILSWENWKLKKSCHTLTLDFDYLLWLRHVEMSKHKRQMCTEVAISQPRWVWVFKLSRSFWNLKFYISIMANLGYHTHTNYAQKKKHSCITNLSFGKWQRLRQLFPFSPHDIVILLEGVLQFQQLRGTKRGSYPFGFPERLQQKTRNIRSWNQNYSLLTSMDWKYKSKCTKVQFAVNTIIIRYTGSRGNGLPGPFSAIMNAYRSWPRWRAQLTSPRSDRNDLRG